MFSGGMFKKMKNIDQKTNMWRARVVKIYLLFTIAKQSMFHESKLGETETPRKTNPHSATNRDGQVEMKNLGKERRERGGSKGGRDDREDTSMYSDNFRISEIRVTLSE